jgi:hypothetical protein
MEGSPLLDPQGTYLMRPREFGRLSDLSEALASFEREGSQAAPNPSVGFIDFLGRVVIPARFYMAYDFSEGVASASVEFEKCGYIDKTGNFVILPIFEFPSYYACGAFS